MKRLFIPLCLFAFAVLLAGCHRSSQQSSRVAGPPKGPTDTTAAQRQAPSPDYLSMILIPQQGTGRTDLEIIKLQEKVATEKDPAPWIERLGWMFIVKARESFDPGYYTLAEACAFCLESREPHSLEAMLLRGHVLQNMHRFKEAEPLARELVARRGLSFDYGLLGDVLMEQGHLSEAVDAYQKMVDQRPDLQAYARIAYLRWLKGDVTGATEVMQLAVSASSPNAPEAAAWVNTRMAMLQFQQGQMTEANESCLVALDYQTNYAPALLLQGRMLLAAGRDTEAVTVLQRAEKLNPLPDYQWVLSEALRASGQVEEAQKVAQELARKGAVTDPRTYSLYLATSGNSPSKALELARNELDTRQDVFTHDAHAWALAANGQTHEAWQEMQLALAEGTKDARLYMHAAVLAAKAGQFQTSRQYESKAESMNQMLLPSERKQLQQLAKQLARTDQEQPTLTASTKNDFIPGN
jgi:tetratricopeptide (TPR) repeat protein